MADEPSQGEKNERAAGAPGPVTLGGRTYLASPPSDRHFGTLHNHLRRKLQTPFQAIADDLKGLPPHLQEAAVRAAVELKAGGGAAMTHQFVADQLQTPDGCAFFCWILIRDNHPDVELKTVRDAIPDVEAAIRTLADLQAATGGLEGNRTGRSAS
jgi:hypothetical protein